MTGKPPYRARKPADGFDELSASEAEDCLSKAPRRYYERLGAQFRDGSIDALSDYELLELVLFCSLPRRDVNPLAKVLIAKFGSFAETIAAPPQRLAEVEGLSDTAITVLKVVEAAAHRLVHEEVKRRAVLSSQSTVLDYCRAAMAFRDCGRFRRPDPVRFDRAVMPTRKFPNWHAAPAVVEQIMPEGTPERPCAVEPIMPQEPLRSLPHDRCDHRFPDWRRA